MTPPDQRLGDAAVADFGTLLATFAANHPEADDNLLRRAYELAEGLHAGQMRKSGEAFINHPLTVAIILAEYGMDTDTIAAALLHDTVEDTDLTLDEVREEFGDEVANLTDGVTKLDRLEFDSSEEQQAATIRKMVVAMAADVRVLLIKLADRMHNIRTLWALSPEKQERVARESLEIYAPLAHRLGVQDIKHEMEDRCFAILYPKRNAEIEQLMAARAPQQEALIEKAVLAVNDALGGHAIKAVTTGRPKHPFSIYRKMIDSGGSFDEIHDIIGIRLVVDDVKDCYAALGTVHTLWPPISGRFKDYIAMPKFNLYQSLHTTVVGPDGKPLEVQIRTAEMDERAEYGIAAHWRYKEGDGDDLRWISDIRFLQDEYPDPSEFLANLKIDLYQDEVFVLTPGGDVINLPKGATPVDFAYSIHTDVGHACVGAKVNGRLVPLSTELDSGDIVEVMTSKSPDAHPSRDWLGFVKSTRAAAKIRQWFTRERREEALANGREAITEALRREGLGLSANERDEALLTVAEAMSFQSIEALFVAVGDGKAASESVVNRLLRIVRPAVEAEPDEVLAPPTPTRRSSGGIVVEGLDDMLVNIARCCAPVPGDGLVGFVTVGRGVSVHRADCTNITALGEKTERMIEVTWDPSTAGSFTVWIQVEALDRPKLLRDVTAIIGDQGANIVASSSSSSPDRIAILRYEVELGDTEQLDRLLADLRGAEGVMDAHRLFTH
ncbi:MAG: bifunctional (p)ppGpp synthetase/guanosine-3',5'-bis(diphosphate) 3'-pyrophosphohydrolase [Acidimicrobiia bacterium]